MARFILTATAGAALVVLGPSGCRTTGSAPVAASQVGEGRPSSGNEMDGLLVTGQEVLDAQTLFDRGRAKLDAKQYAQAAKDYDLLVESFPWSSLAPPARYNAGLAFERMGDFRSAEERYRLLVASAPRDPIALDASFRQGGCLVEIGQYAASDEVFARVLGRTDLSLEDRIEAMTRRGFAAYKMGQTKEAEKRFAGVLGYFADHESDERLESNFFVAMAQFHMGQLAEDRFVALPLRAPERLLAKDLEDKAGQLLTAQHQYVLTIKLKNAHWAAAAGYRIAYLYRTFFDEIVALPSPPELAAKPEANEIYQEEVRRRLRPLLEKALRTYTQSLDAARRAGVDNDYVRKSQEELGRLREYLSKLEP